MKVKEKKDYPLIRKRTKAREIAIQMMYCAEITEETPELFEAAKQSLIARGDPSTGWSMGWKVCLWAMLGEGDRALDLCDMLLRVVTSTREGSVGGGVYTNLLCACPPFQIDGNFGIIAAINEMLVQTKDGEVTLLPALPKLWKNGRVKGLRVEGKTVDVEWRDGKITSSSVISE